MSDQSEPRKIADEGPEIVVSGEQAKEVLGRIAEEQGE